MIYRLSQNIAFYLLKKGLLDKREVDIYRYGVEIIFCSMIDVAIVLITGIVFGKLHEAVWYYVIFCLLRHRFGGYHAETLRKCKTMMLFMMCFVLYAGNMCSHYISAAGAVIIYVLMCNSKKKSDKYLYILLYGLIEIPLLLVKSNLAALTMWAFIIVAAALNYNNKIKEETK